MVIMMVRDDNEKRHTHTHTRERCKIDARHKDQVSEKEREKFRKAVKLKFHFLTKAAFSENLILKLRAFQEKKVSLCTKIVTKFNFELPHLHVNDVK
jgi:hypothetical protein